MNKLLEYNNDEGTNGLSPTTRKTLNEIEQGVINAPEFVKEESTMPNGQQNGNGNQAKYDHIKSK